MLGHPGRPVMIRLTGRDVATQRTLNSNVWEKKQKWCQQREKRPYFRISQQTVFNITDYSIYALLRSYLPVKLNWIWQCLMEKSLSIRGLEGNLSRAEPGSLLTRCITLKIFCSPALTTNKHSEQKCCIDSWLMQTTGWRFQWNV